MLIRTAWLGDDAHITYRTVDNFVSGGCLSSVQNNANLLEDPDLALKYETIRRVTRGPIWSKRRWDAIVALNVR